MPPPLPDPVFGGGVSENNLMNPQQKPDSSFIYDTSIGALVFRTGGSAMAQGDFALMSQGRLQLNYLGAEPDVVAGDLIVTSGLGGYYPSQLVIGCVEEVRTSENGLAQYAVLRPEAELGGLTQVFIVTSFDIVD